MEEVRKSNPPPRQPAFQKGFDQAQERQSIRNINYNEAEPGKSDDMMGF
jgi:hypothetical protein